MHIDNTAPNQGGQGNFYGSVNFTYYFPNGTPDQALLSPDLQQLASLIANFRSPATYAAADSSPLPHIVLLAARDRTSSAHYVAAVKAFAEQQRSAFAGGIFWFDQQAGGDTIIRQVKQDGRARAVRTDFEQLEEPQQLAAVQRVWQAETGSLLIFSGIDSLEALQQLGTVLPRPIGSPVLIISSWHRLTQLIDLNDARDMRLLDAAQIDLLYDSILAAASNDKPVQAILNPCIYLDSFPRGAAVETEDTLTSVFHKPNIYSNLISIGKRPSSHVIFGGKGAGKTVLCKRLEKEYLGQPQVLTVRLRTVSIQQCLLAGQPITFESWTQEFIAQLLNALVKRLRYESKRRQKLQEQSYEAEQLMGLCAITHADPPQLPTPPDMEALRERIANRNSFERLATFADILKSAGFAYALILIDDINNQLFDGNESLALRVISPLLQTLGSVQDYRLAIKLFLPDKLRASVEPEVSNFMDVYEITWSDDDLREMVRLRLAQAGLSPDEAEDMAAATISLDYPERFDVLCESNLADGNESIDDLLIRLAEQRPGRLMHMINQILARHCSGKSAAHSVLIRRATINDVLSSVAAGLR